MSRNRMSTECECGWPLDQATLEGPELDEATYLAEVGQLRYLGNQGYGWAYGANHGDLSAPEVLFQKVSCPICDRLYAVWLAQGRMGLWIFDSSFYWAFNDEPSSRDDALNAPTSKEILLRWKAAGRP